MTIAVYIVAGLAGVFVVLNLVALALPPTWSVERRGTLAADHAVAHPLIASFRHGWSRWNPWGPAADRTIVMTYAGPDVGVGATQTWTGGETGGGTMTIVEAGPDHVSYDLAFGPFTITGRLELAAAAAGTNLHWLVSGRIAGLPAFRLGRYFAQRVVGRALERGIATLAAEAAADAARRSDAAA